MANGHINNHTSTCNANGDTDIRPTSDTEDMEDTVEFRIMMAYAQRRRPGDVRLSTKGHPSARQGEADTNGTGAPKTSGETDRGKKKKKKKKGVMKELQRFFICSRDRPRGEEGEGEEEEKRGESESGGHFRSMGQADDVEGEEELEEVVCRLTKIADGIEFTPPDIEPDGEEDDVEKLIGLLLRETGDRFNEEVLKDASLASELFGKYSFYEKLMSALLSRLGFTPFDPEAPGSPKTQIALTCEVTNRLSAVDTHPMNCLMGFGAKYLREHYSKWVAQQGGYEEAFHSEDDDTLAPSDQLD